MTKNSEEIILEELFRLSHKVDNIQEKMNEMVTRDELKKELSKLATKEEISKLATKEEISKLATKEEISKLATKEEICKFLTREEFDKAMKEQAKEIADIFHNTFRTTTKFIKQNLR